MTAISVNELFSNTVYAAISPVRRTGCSQLASRNETGPAHRMAGGNLRCGLSAAPDSGEDRLKL